jgi:hypothetical protein
MSKLQARITRAKARLGLAAATVTDRSPRDWYAPFCPRGRAPGGCRAGRKGAQKTMAELAIQLAR